MKTIDEDVITASIDKMIEEASIHAAEALLRNRYGRALEEQHVVQVLRELKGRLIKGVNKAENDDGGGDDAPDISRDNLNAIPTRRDGDSYLDKVVQRNRWKCWEQKYCKLDDRCPTINALARPHVIPSGVEIL